MKLLRRSCSFVTGAFLSCMLGFGIFGSDANGQSSMDVVYPAGGERLHPGDTCIIQWNGGATAGNVDLLLWNGGAGGWDTIATSVSGGAQTYMWVIPSDYNDSRFRLKIVAQSSTTELDPVMSPSYFFIVPPELVETQQITQETVPSRPVYAIQVAPNPATENVVVSWGGADIVTARICDLQGGEIVSQGVGGTSFCTFNVRDLPAGTYLVDLKASDGAHEVRKVVLVK